MQATSNNKPHIIPAAGVAPQYLSTQPSTNVDSCKQLEDPIGLISCGHESNRTTHQQWHAGHRKVCHVCSKTAPENDKVITICGDALLSKNDARSDLDTVINGALQEMQALDPNHRAYLPVASKFCDAVEQWLITHPRPTSCLEKYLEVIEGLLKSPTANHRKAGFERFCALPELMTVRLEKTASQDPPNRIFFAYMHQAF